MSRNSVTPAKSPLPCELTLSRERIGPWARVPQSPALESLKYYDDSLYEESIHYTLLSHPEVSDARGRP